MLQSDFKCFHSGCYHESVRRIKVKSPRNIFVCVCVLFKFYMDFLDFRLCYVMTGQHSRVIIALERVKLMAWGTFRRQEETYAAFSC